MATENTEILQMHDLKPAPGAKKDRIRVWPQNPPVAAV